MTDRESKKDNNSDYHIIKSRHSLPVSKFSAFGSLKIRVPAFSALPDDIAVDDKQFENRATDSESDLPRIVSDTESEDRIINILNMNKSDTIETDPSMDDDIKDNSNINNSTLPIFKPIFHSGAKSQAMTPVIMARPKRFMIRARSTTPKHAITNSGPQPSYNSVPMTDKKNQHKVRSYSNVKSLVNQTKMKQKFKSKNDLKRNRQMLQFCLTFHVNNQRSTRIKLDLGTTPTDIVHQLCDDSYIGNNSPISRSSDILSSNQKFGLCIQMNPDFEKIFIKHEFMGMPFWELLVEFGIFNLLHFNICSETSSMDGDFNDDENFLNFGGIGGGNNGKTRTNKNRKTKKKTTSIWKIFR